MKELSFDDRTGSEKRLDLRKRKLVRNLLQIRDSLFGRLLGEVGTAQEASSTAG
jgi:hypothetical protein